MKDLYSYTEKLKGLYEVLQDDLSRKVFWARLMYDIDPSAKNGMRLATLRSGVSEQQILLIKSWQSGIKRLNDEGKKLLIYGTGIRGQTIARYLLEEKLDFYGFTGHSWRKYPNGLKGKPVYPEEWLFDRSGDPDTFVIIGATNEAGNHQEISALLMEHHFSKGCIVPYFEPITEGVPEKYFEFPELFRKNTAFADFGCCNGLDCLRFASWCGGQYSKIFAFEANPDNADLCEKTFATEKIKRTQVIRAAVSGSSGFLSFELKSNSNGGALSEANNLQHGEICYANKEIIQVPSVRFDDIAGDEVVGMIKMDIEGAEYDALCGAAKVITRDKPLLAVCIYHKVGDMPALMELCRRMVPEYRFWLRQYDGAPCETVMYAAADTF